MMARAVFAMSLVASLLAVPATADPVIQKFQAGHSNGTVATGVDDDGTITGYTISGANMSGFVRPVSGQMHAFAVSGATDTIPAAIDMGWVAGNSYQTTGCGQPFVRTPAGTLTSFTVHDSRCAFAAAISNAVITGAYSNNQRYHGFLRPPVGKIITFNVPGAWSTSPQAINVAGTVVGTFLDSSRNFNHGFIRTAAGAFTTVDVPGAPVTEVLAINRDGTIAGVYSDLEQPFHCFLRSPDGTITTFEIAGAVSAAPAAINSDGVIAGNYLDSHFVLHAFVRAADGTITLIDVPKSMTTSVHGLNAAGAIVGEYRQSSSPDKTKAFWRTP